jgi:hypothetical protein
MTTVSPLFPAILRGSPILLIPYVPVSVLSYLQGFDTKVTTVVSLRKGKEGDSSLWCLTEKATKHALEAYRVVKRSICPPVQ